MNGFTIFLLILNLILMIVFYALLSSRYSSKKILRDLRSEVDKLVSDLGREADRDVALLESRIKGLRGLIEDADKRILLANREVTRREEAITTLADTSERLEAKPRATGESVTIYSRPSIHRSERQIEPVVPVRERVLELAVKGISPEMIAHSLSLPLGEVQLILDMNNSSL